LPASPQQVRARRSTRVNGHERKWRQVSGTFRNRVVLRFFEFISLYWVSATGRWIVLRFHGKKIALPRTGLVNNDISERKIGLFERLRGDVRFLAYDQLYFLVGLAF
jgi:hypothetical protein